MAAPAAPFPFKVYKKEGVWQLKEETGKYIFNEETGEVDLGGDKAKFFCTPISSTPLELEKPSTGRAKERLAVKSSEIMKEIQNEEDNGVCPLFVLPSQLNGAEYTSHEIRSIVTQVEEYMYDNTGGPRGQLAAHPGAAQFVIDNAANENQPDGINAVDELLKVEVVKEWLELKNGYLEIKNPNDTKVEDMVLAKMDENLHTLRPLVMENIPASGLNPKKAKRSTTKHKVGLVYASAVPVQSYMNQGSKAGSREFQEKVAAKILIAQYFGALQHAANFAKENKLEKRTVFLMPLGGGVFRNKWEDIAGGMAKAMEMLDEESLNLLDVKALAWEGSRSEEETLNRLLKET